MSDATQRDTGRTEGRKFRLEAIEPRKRFGVRPVLNGVSLSINQGDAVGLFGPVDAG